MNRNISALIAITLVALTAACSNPKGGSSPVTAQAPQAGNADAGTPAPAADSPPQAPPTPQQKAAAPTTPNAPTTPSAPATAPTAKPGMISLRLNLEKGKKLKYSTEAQTTTKGGESIGMPASMNQKVEQTVAVKEKTNDGYKLEFTITDISPSMPQAQGNKASEKNATDPKGRTWTAVYNTLGRTKDLSAAQGMASANPMAASMLGSLAAAGIESGFMQVYLPEQPVAVGSTWTQEYDLAKLLGQQATFFKVKKGGKIILTHKVTAIEKQGNNTIVTISTNTSGDGEFAFTMPERPNSDNQQKPTQQEVTISVTLSGTQTAQVDAATGLPILITSSQASSINMGSMAMSHSTKSTTRLVT